MQISKLTSNKFKSNMQLNYDPIPSQKVQKKVDYFFRPYDNKTDKEYYNLYGSGLYKPTARGPGWSRVKDFIYKPLDKPQKK